MKKHVLRFFAAFAVCIALSASAQTNRSKEMLRQALREYHFATFYKDSQGRSFVREYTKITPEAHPLVVSYWTMRGVEMTIAARTKPKDKITVGLMSIADNLGADDLTSDGVSWRDEDRVFGFRSLKRISYRYKPREFPNGLLPVLDEAFGQPIRVFLTKTLAF